MGTRLGYLYISNRFWANSASWKQFSLLWRSLPENGTYVEQR